MFLNWSLDVIFMDVGDPELKWQFFVEDVLASNDILGTSVAAAGQAPRS